MHTSVQSEQQPRRRIMDPLSHDLSNLRQPLLPALMPSTPFFKLASHEPIYEQRSSSGLGNLVSRVPMRLTSPTT